MAYKTQLVPLSIKKIAIKAYVHRTKSNLLYQAVPVNVLRPKVKTLVLLPLSRAGTCMYAVTAV